MLKRQDYVKVFIKLTMVLIFTWIIFLLVSGILIHSSIFVIGGGATVFSILPALTFLLTIFFLDHRKSNYVLKSVFVFWFSIFFSVFLFLNYVTKMEHWPFGLLIIFLALGIISILQAIFFLFKEYKTRHYGSYNI